MARIAAWVPDLLFGSRVVGIAREAGHEAVLVDSLERLALAHEEAPVALVIADLTAEGAQRARDLAAVRPAGVPVLGCFAHVEPEVRAAALDAGLDLVVPRSRLVREGPALIASLLADPGAI